METQGFQEETLGKPQWNPGFAMKTSGKLLRNLKIPDLNIRETTWKPKKKINVVKELIYV